MAGIIRQACLGAMTGIHRHTIGTLRSASMLTKHIGAIYNVSYTQNQPFSSLTKFLSHNLRCTNSSILTPQILKPAMPLIEQTCGYKVKGKLKLRCSSCFFVKRLGRGYVECHRKPRHRQMQKQAKHMIYQEDSRLAKGPNPLRDVLHYKMGQYRSASKK
ncbi:unnamed protein product [Owenia fusiformis]|uniref:Large ribosomal subunit protein bL36m n=1 Tax=Owenia fusiformis TaxID=6347 RepID=A0A8J1TTK0_OWEFU|nr:unnamed protein product [Owenia fusiformis]